MHVCMYINEGDVAMITITVWKCQILFLPCKTDKSFKAHANGRNKCQQLPTLLSVVGQQGCVRLHGPKSIDRLQTIRNKCQEVPTLLWFHANGRNKSQHCWAQQCWVLLANNAGSVCMGLYMFGAYTLAIYSKYFIVQRGIKSIFSVPAHCQNLNILNRRKTIQQMKTISDVLTAYVFTIKW